MTVRPGDHSGGGVRDREHSRVPRLRGISSLETNGISEVAEFFRLLPAKFHAGRTHKTLVYYFSIDEEKWTVTVSADRCEVERGKKAVEADCFLKTSTEIFLSTIRGEYMPSMMDVVTGRLKTNSPILLSTFKSVFS